MKSIIGRKMGMTQVFAEDGTMYSVTVVEVLPNAVTQIKTVAHDGYDAIQVGYEDQKESRANKCEKGIYKKANVAVKQNLKELKGDELASYKVGDEIKASIFKVGDVVDVVGVSKGKGYTGPVKAFHQKIGPKGHGSGFHRGAGSFANTGLGTNRVLPGKRMAGRRGAISSTIQNLVIIAVDDEKNVILVRGGIPGPKKALVTIRSAIRAQLRTPLTVKPLINRLEVEEVVEEVVETPVEEAPVVETPVVEAAPEEKAPEAAPSSEESK